MKILILEDSTERIKIFQKKLKEHDLFFFDNVKDAIRAVDYIKNFDMYFIDHDLENKMFVDSNYQNTGYQFAKYLASKEIVKDTIIHSMNFVGAKNIQAVLPHAKIIPFSNLF